jgi:hypothetical protein
MKRSSARPAVELCPKALLVRLLEPQHEFLDFAGTCFSEASFSGDDAKAAFLEDAARRDVVGGDACVDRARWIKSQERGEGAGRDPLARVGPADPVRDLALAGVAPRPNRPSDFPSTTMALLIVVSSARSLLQRRSNASRSMSSGGVKAAMCAATGSAHCSNSTARSSSRTSRNTHFNGRILADSEARGLMRNSVLAASSQ